MTKTKKVAVYRRVHDKLEFVGEIDNFFEQSSVFKRLSEIATIHYNEDGSPISNGIADNPQFYKGVEIPPAPPMPPKKEFASVAEYDAVAAAEVKRKQAENEINELKKAVEFSRVDGLDRKKRIMDALDLKEMHFWNETTNLMYSKFKERLLEELYIEDTDIHPRLTDITKIKKFQAEPAKQEMPSDKKVIRDYLEQQIVDARNGKCNGKWVSTQLALDVLNALLRDLKHPNGGW